MSRRAVPASIRALAAVLLIATASPALSAQSNASRELSLIRPDDNEFGNLLDAKFPGLSALDSFSTVRPFLVLVRNDTSNHALAYDIQWETRFLDGRLSYAQYHYIQKRFGRPQERRAFGRGEIRLISLFFDLSPSEYALRRASLSDHLAALSSRPPFSAANIQSVAARVDAVIYDDGAYVGPDHSHLFSRYTALRDAERDEAAAVVQLMATNAAPGDVIAQLERDVQAGLAVRLSPTRDPDALYSMQYALQRGYQAQALLSLYRQSGMQALHVRASVQAAFPRETFTRIPPN